MGQWFNRPGSNLATVARETGYPVVEIPGWTTRGQGPLGDYVGGIVCHHTAGPEPENTPSNYPSLNVVTYGRSGLWGLLSQLGLGFDGTIYVMGAGLAWHAGAGGWGGLHYNSQVLGIEAEDAGDGDWMPAQLDCYPRLVAALSQFLGTPASMVAGHKEWTSAKIDPAGIDMNDFRGTVAWYLDHPDQIRATGGTGPGGDTAGGIESMALDTEFTDWADNPQTVRSWMNHVDRRLYYALQELRHEYPSTVPDSDYTAQMGQMAANSDGYGWRTQQRLDSLETKVDEILAALNPTQ